MADGKKRISELTECTDISGLVTIGVNADGESVKVALGDLIESSTAAHALTIDYNPSTSNAGTANKLRLLDVNGDVLSTINIGEAIVEADDDGNITYYDDDTDTGSHAGLLSVANLVKLNTAKTNAEAAFNAVSITKGASSNILTFTNAAGETATATLSTANSSTAGLLTSTRYKALLSTITASSTDSEINDYTLTFTSVGGDTIASISFPFVSAGQHGGMLTLEQYTALASAIDVAVAAISIDREASYITLTLTNSSGTELGSVKLPAVTTSQAGLLSSSQYSALTSADETNAAAAEAAQSTADAALEELETLSAQIVALAAGISVSGSVSPSCIYKYVATAVTVTGKMSGATADTIKIVDSDGTTLSSSTSVASTSGTNTYTMSASSMSFTITATYSGMTFTATATLYARYPIYYGFGSSVYDIVASGTILSARTSAATTYSATATDDGQYFYILVPSDVSALSSFTMGGAPYVMNSSSETINISITDDANDYSGTGNIISTYSVTYKVYQSGATYDTGASVTVVAS